MPRVDPIQYAAGVMLDLADEHFEETCATLSLAAAWVVVGTLGFLFAGIFARGFGIMAVAQLVWLGAGMVSDRAGGSWTAYTVVAAGVIAATRPRARSITASTRPSPATAVIAR